MSRPWRCDGCGDLQDHDGTSSYSVTQRALRTRAEEAEARLAALEAERLDCCERNAVSAIVAEDSAVRAHRRAEEAERKLEEAREVLRSVQHRRDIAGRPMHCVCCGHLPCESDCRLAGVLGEGR